MTRIADLLSAGPTYSFEFFPPKNDQELAALARTLRELQPLGPSFVSVTYRGGAESRQRTLNLVTGMLHTSSWCRWPTSSAWPTPASSWPRSWSRCARPGSRTCWPSGATRPPTRPPGPASSPTPSSWSSWPGPSAASRSGGRPPGRPSRLDRPASDRDCLAEKLALADFGITQFFFEADEYEGLVADLAERGIHKPVLPGIMPVTSLSTIAWLPWERPCRPGWRSASSRRGGVAPTPSAGRGRAGHRAVPDLLDSGVPGLHFYTLNTSSATREIYPALGLAPHRLRSSDAGAG